MLTNESKSVLRQAVEARFPERHQTRDAVLIELLFSLLQSQPKFSEELDFNWASQDKTAKSLVAVDWLWEAVDGVLAGAHSAVTRYPDDGQQMARWSYPIVRKLDDKKDSSSDEGAAMADLSNCAAAYLSARWAESPTLELWLARQLIYAEAYAFGRVAGIPMHLKSVKLWWIWLKSTFKWALGLAVALTLGGAFGWAVGVLAYATWLALIRYLANDQLKRYNDPIFTFSEMRNAYVVSLRSPTCPVEVEKSLSTAEEKGALWPAGLRALVERALSRDRAVWM
jgi:hypothetical protein